MKHLFVPYEIALKLKEKGFNEPCLAVYTKKEELEPIHPKDREFKILKQSEVNSTYVECIAPLYQQVTNWLIESRGIVVGIDTYGDYNFACKIWKKGANPAKPNKYSYYSMTEYYDTHYEALNKAIEEALKLI